MGKREKILDDLRRAGAAGLTKSKLVSGKKSESEIALAELVSSGVVVNLHTDKFPTFVTQDNARIEERALELVRSLQRSGAPTLHKAQSILSPKCKYLAVKTAVPAVVKELMARREIIPLESGISKYFLFTTAVLEWIGETSTQQPFSPLQDLGPHVATLEKRIMDAYHRIVQRTRMPAVFISDLQLESGIASGELQSFLIASSKEGKTVPSSGDWSVASEEQRNAAIHINGKPHLFIRFPSDL